jgi:spore coat protein H
MKLWLAALVLLASCGSEDPHDPTPDPDGGPDPSGLGIGDEVFDTSVLHEIIIEVDPDDLASLEDDHDERVPCTFTFDGIVLTNVAIRQKGQGTSFGSIFTKPSFSVKFDEIERGQKLDGIDKLVLNNASADPSFLHEALGNELHHRAGVPAPRTSHAVITFIGLPEGPRVYGIHVIVEAVNPDFLGRHFGFANRNGNLYEGSAGDFVTAPLQTELKDEGDGRTRDHLVELARLITDPPDVDFAEQLGTHLDIDRVLATYAIDAISGNWDGYWFATHNYYLFDNPGDGRFVLMPHGMDLLLDGCSDIGSATAALAERIRAIPELNDRLYEVEGEILGDVWDPVALTAKVDEFTGILTASSHDEASFRTDLEAHLANRDRIVELFEATESAFQGEPVCGNGTVERAEICARQCDDGNLLDGDGCSALCAPEVICGDGRVVWPETCDDENFEEGDGCSATCLVEFCGDGITQEALGEDCDGELRCREDCSGMIPCGDGLTEWPEYCDDGNQSDDDGCTSRCEASCVSRPRGGTTFELCMAETSYALSTAICAHVGAAPATPLTEEEDLWLRTETQLVAPGPWWLGLQQTDGEWRTAGGAVLRFEGWASGEPDGAGACGVIDPEAAGAGWNDVSCDEPHPVVCRH